MSTELTRWFPARIKPARDGVYQIVFNDGSAKGCYARFSQGLWSAFEYTAERAAQSSDFASAIQNKRWRGLAKKPATKDAEVSNG
jgi:hypothetical protein